MILIELCRLLPNLSENIEPIGNNVLNKLIASIRAQVKGVYYVS